jgi:hypothetical protein
MASGGLYTPVLVIFGPNYYYIHCEAEYEHFTDNMFHSNTYIHLNINH